MPTRTADPAPRRATVTARTGRTTVTTGPSAFGNADGPGSLPTTGAISRHARVTENVHYDSEVTAVLQGTRTPSACDRGTPTSQAIAAARRSARTDTAVQVALPDGRRGVRFQATDVFGYSSLPWSCGSPGTWLYRMFSPDGALLYIGISGGLGARMDLHRTRAPWWTEVDHVIVTMIGAEHIALNLERAVIRAEMPRYNVRSKPGAQPRAAA